MSTAVLVLQTWRCDNCWVRAKRGKGIQSHRDCSSQLDKYCLQSNRAALPRLNLLCDVARLFSTDSSSNCRAAYCTAASMVYLSKKRVVPGLASYGAHKQPATAPKRTTSEPHGRLTTSVKHMHIYEHSCAHRYFHTYVYTNIYLTSLLTCLVAIHILYASSLPLPFLGQSPRFWRVCTFSVPSCPPPSWPSP